MALDRGHGGLLVGVGLSRGGSERQGDGDGDRGNGSDHGTSLRWWSELREGF
jgi:hypothetical protein